MTNKILFFILIAFTLSACENNIYQVSELREATEKLSRGELPPDFKYPKNTLHIDSLKIRIAPCKEDKGEKCSEGLVSELLMSSATYFDSTLAYTETIFSVKSPGSAKLESNYMDLYNSAKKLATLKGTTLKLSAQQTEALEERYTGWDKSSETGNL
jgi:transcriptional regulatory protein LevR